MSDDMQKIFGQDDATQPEVGKSPESEQPIPDAAQPEGDAKGENEAAPPAAEVKDERHVPFEALRDERTKRQAAERERDEMRNWQRSFEAQQRQARLQSIEDPDERLDAVQQEAAQAVMAVRMDTSRRYAERQHGPEFVAEVVEFFNDPQHAPISHQFLRTEDPFGAAVDYFNAQKALKEIGPDPAAFETKLREKIRAEMLAEASPPKPKTPPPSMAAAPSAGGEGKPSSAFEQMFGG